MTTAISILSEALSHAGEDQQMLERLSHLEERRITPDKELPPMEFLFRLFGTPCFPRGELVGLTGKPKSGKTFISSILMALCYRQEFLTIRRESPSQLRVLWYDTEQSDESTQDILRNRIIPMIETIPNPPLKGGSVDAPIDTWGLFNPSPLSGGLEGSFHVFNVRQDAWRERLPLLEAAITRFKPDLVILDGIRDLVNDINDGVLAQDTVERLMNIASANRCCITCILHQNKSAEDKNLRGWIGTELTHKSFEVYECEKDGDRIFSFSQKLTRKYDIYDTLKYIVDENGIPQLASIETVLASEQHQRQQSGARPDLNRDYIIEWEGSKPVFDLKRVFADAMPEEGALYIAKDMQMKVMDLTHITSPYFYNTLREQALKEGIVVKVNNEHGFVAYYRPKTSNESSPVTEAKVEEVKKSGKELDLFRDSPGDVPF